MTDSQLERENRKLKREISHLTYALAQEKFALTSILNHQKSSTFIQRERERYLSLLLANSPNIILFLNEHLRIDFCTDYFVRKTGHKSAVQLLGSLFSETVAPFLRAGCFERLFSQCNSVMVSNITSAIELAFSFDKNEEPEVFAGQIVSMRDEQLGTEGILIVFQDITDIKRSREEAISANKAKSEFLSAMSHEIRTPMNAIIGMTSIGKNDSNINRKDYAFEKIESASIHLLGVINDILDISKIESGKMELSNVTFEFSRMVTRIKDVVLIRMKEKEQSFYTYIDKNIPEMLYGDDQRLAQVITNLLSNAIKFTAEGGNIELSISLRDLNEDSCVIQGYVKDSGIGISEQEQKKLFKAFQQAQAGTSRQYGGTGLGLAISKRILSMMGGDIWVESESNIGSTFYFTAVFSMPDANGFSAGAERDANGGDTTERDFSGKYILLADDLDINLEIVSAVLEPSNIAIDTAGSGREAFDLFLKNPGRYDLILMDMQMPEVDGLQATGMIRSSGVPGAESIPIIAMTANVFKEDINKCLEAGMNNHIGKPVSANEIFKVINRYLS